MKRRLWMGLVAVLMTMVFHSNTVFQAQELPSPATETPPAVENASPPSTDTTLPLRIMPLGDSITYGAGVLGGYRTHLWQLLSEDNRPIDLVGSQAHGPDTIDRDHEGHPGKAIQYIRENIVDWLEQSHPDVVLLMIGTNDILYPQAHDFPHVGYRFKALVDQITINAPEAKLIVASVPPLTDPIANERVKQVNTEIQTIVETSARRGRSVYFVDMFEIMTINDLADGVHPNAAGYDKMAQAWYTALLNCLD